MSPSPPGIPSKSLQALRLGISVVLDYGPADGVAGLAGVGGRPVALAHRRPAKCAVVRMKPAPIRSS